MVILFLVSYFVAGAIFCGIAWHINKDVYLPGCPTFLTPEEAVLTTIISWPIVVLYLVCIGVALVIVPIYIRIFRLNWHETSRPKDNTNGQCGQK
jgi:hypothetical protein